jgi:2-octaprenyl-6-methoxyphenol hydroxylase
MKSIKNIKYDIAIVGGGYLGLSAAIAFGKQGFSIILINDKDLSRLVQTDSPRLFAIARGSLDIFRRLGIDADFSNIGRKISVIRVVDGRSDSYLEFDPKDIGSDNFGVMIEEDIVHNLLYEKANSMKNIMIYNGIKIKNVSSKHYGVTIRGDFGEIDAVLGIAADGKRSFIRDLLGIEIVNKKYNQIAVVADVTHEYKHNGIAIENFFPSGPFAILPKKDDYTSSIVWTLPSAYKASVKNLSASVMYLLIQERFGDVFGKIKLKSKPSVFPLGLTYAKQYHANRFALLGDSLHSIHPLAGQGLNLSLRDLEVLYDIVSEFKGSGLDYAGKISLDRYHKARRTDNLIMIEATDILNMLFSNDISSIKFFRRRGLELVNNISSIKKLFMNYASGLNQL